MSVSAQQDALGEKHCSENEQVLSKTVPHRVHNIKTANTYLNIEYLLPLALKVQLYPIMNRINGISM